MWNLSELLTITDPHAKLLARQFVVMSTNELLLILTAMVVIGLVLGVCFHIMKHNQFVAFLNANKLNDKYEQWKNARERAMVHWGIKE